MRSYIQGERLCDDGDTHRGVQLLRKAAALAWELESETWPDWASNLYDKLNGKHIDESPPKLIGKYHADHTVRMKTHPDTSLNWDRSSPSWLSEQKLREIGSKLKLHNFVIVDDLMGQQVAGELFASCAAAWDQGLLHPAKISSPGNGYVEQSVHTRSDHIAWIAGDEGGVNWEPLLNMCSACDELCRALCDDEVFGLSAVRTRMRPMLSRYGKGARFARHCDSHCDRGQGPHCNGRVLTAVYYLNQSWVDRDGGCLRVYRSQVRGREEEEEEEDEDISSDAVADVAPISDRLVLFYSDFRCPHEVLEVNGESRFAITLWYMSERVEGG